MKLVLHFPFFQYIIKYKLVLGPFFHTVEAGGSTIAKKNWKFVKVDLRSTRWNIRDVLIQDQVNIMFEPLASK